MLRLPFETNAQTYIGANIGCMHSIVQGVISNPTFEEPSDFCLSPIRNEMDICIQQDDTAKLNLTSNEFNRRPFGL